MHLPTSSSPTELQTRDQHPSSIDHITHGTHNETTNWYSSGHQAPLTHNPFVRSGSVAQWHRTCRCRSQLAVPTHRLMTVSLAHSLTQQSASSQPTHEQNSFQTVADTTTQPSTIGDDFTPNSRLARLTSRLTTQRHENKEGRNGPDRQAIRGDEGSSCRSCQSVAEPMLLLLSSFCWSHGSCAHDTRSSQSLAHMSRAHDVHCGAKRRHCSTTPIPCDGGARASLFNWFREEPIHIVPRVFAAVGLFLLTPSGLTVMSPLPPKSTAGSKDVVFNDVVALSKGFGFGAVAAFGASFGVASLRKGFAASRIAVICGTSHA